MGFSLGEIRDLLSLREDREADAHDMRERARAKISDIEDKIRTLRAMKNALTTLAGKCPGCGPLSECPILDALDDNGLVA